MEWVRGETIGRGCFGKVNLAIVKNSGDGFPPLMAVKSAPVYNSESLKNEKEILGLLGNNSGNVIRCFGDSCSTSDSDGQMVYNVFLEYADGGSLFDRVRKCDGEGGGEGLSDSEVKSYTRSVLKGLNYVHSNGFVHCDVKLQNILLCSSSSNDVVAKIADFGLARRQRQNRADGIKGDEFEFRGTPLYMAPETAVSGECDSPADIWAVGCAVVEMLTGVSVWKNESNIASLLLKIATQSPELPTNLSSEIRDFVEKCFIKDVAKRWTAEMLLNHPFIIETLIPNSSDAATKSPPPKTTTVSPRCPFDFSEFITPTPISESGFDSWIEKDENFSSVTDSSSPAVKRFRQLVSEKIPEWVFTDSWLVVRQ